MRKHLGQSSKLRPRRSVGKLARIDVQDRSAVSLGIAAPKSLRKRVRQAQVYSGQRVGMTGEKFAEVCRLRAEANFAGRMGSPKRHRLSSDRVAQGHALPDCRSRSPSTCSGSRAAYSRRSGAAAGGPAPEGGTASSASAKVPSGRLAPRRPRTPTKRHQTPQDLPGF